MELADVYNVLKTVLIVQMQLSAHNVTTHSTYQQGYVPYVLSRDVYRATLQIIVSTVYKRCGKMQVVAHSALLLVYNAVEAQYYAKAALSVIICQEPPVYHAHQ